MSCEALIQYIPSHVLNLQYVKCCETLSIEEAHISYMFTIRILEVYLCSRVMWRWWMTSALHNAAVRWCRAAAESHSALFTVLLLRPCARSAGRRWNEEEAGGPSDRSQSFDIFTAQGSTSSCGWGPCDVPFLGNNSGCKWSLVCIVICILHMPPAAFVTP